MQKKILFFLQNLEPTGAEIMIFNLIKDLKLSSTHTIGIVLFEKGGGLVNELPKGIKLYYLDQEFSLLDKIFHQLGQDILFHRLKKIQEDFQADYWYFNTIRNGGLLRYKTVFSVQTYVHIHELYSPLDTISKKDFNDLIRNTDHFIACSDLVKDIYLPFITADITTINSTIQPIEISSDKLKIKNPKRKIIGAGSINYGKGLSFFYQIASLFPKESFEFIWLGRFSNNGYSEIIKRQNEKTNWIHFISPSSREEYINLVSQADIFLSTSIEESMGLVMMEAISLGIPVIATPSKGSELIVHDKNGKIVYDTRATVFAEAIHEILNRSDQSFPSRKLPFDYSQELQKFKALFG